MKILAFFTNNNVPETGLNPTVRVRDLSDDSLVITDETMIESGDGHYQYDFTTYDATKDYAIRCDGGGTLPAADRYKYSGNENYFDDMQEAVWSAYVSAYSGNAGSAATIQENLIYGNTVAYDVSGSPGTDFPIGSHRYPSNNLSDVLSIANSRQIESIHVHSDLTITAGSDAENMIFFSPGFMGTDLTIEENANVNNSAFRNLNLHGTLSDDNGNTILVEDCTVYSFENFQGVMSTVTFGQGAEITIGGWAEVIQGTAGGEPTNEAEIDIGLSTLNMSHWTGNLKLKGKNADNRTVINCNSGNILIDSTCVSGTIQLLGIGQIESDNSGPNCKVDTDSFISRVTIAESVWDEPLADHITNETTGYALLQQAYDGEVYIDVINGTAGTVYPAGIKQHPVNSMSDALTVASLYELTTINVIGSLTISGGEDLDGLTFQSDRSLGNSVSLINYTSNYTYFNDLTVSGTLTGSTRFTYCVLGELTGLEGGIKNSLITDDITFVKNGNNYMTDCDRFISAENTFININIADSDFNMIRGRGNYNIAGKTSTGITSLDLNGVINIDSTCVSGTIVIAGLTRIIDNSGPNCLVLQANLTNSSIVDAVWDESTSSHSASGSFSNMLQRTIGLLHENIYIDNPIYDGDGNLTSARTRIYSNSGSVGTLNDVIGTYEITAPGNGAGKFTSWSQIKV